MQLCTCGTVADDAAWVRGGRGCPKCGKPWPEALTEREERAEVIELEDPRQALASRVVGSWLAGLAAGACGSLSHHDANHLRDLIAEALAGEAPPEEQTCWIQLVDPVSLLE